MKTKKAKKTKKYYATIDLRYSYDCYVNANSKCEARQNAFIKFNKQLQKRDFNIDVDIV